MTPDTAIAESVGFCAFFGHTMHAKSLSDIMFVVGQFCKSDLVSLLGAKCFPLRK